MTYQLPPCPECGGPADTGAGHDCEPDAKLRAGIAAAIDTLTPSHPRYEPIDQPDAEPVGWSCYQPDGNPIAGPRTTAAEWTSSWPPAPCPPTFSRLARDAAAYEGSLHSTLRSMAQATRRDEYRARFGLHPPFATAAELREGIGRQSAAR